MQPRLRSRDNRESLLMVNRNSFIDAQSADSAMTQSPSMVFGLGLSKTGTSSLGAALNQLGIPTVHYPPDASTMKSLSEGNFRLALLERYRGIVDITVAPFYAELDRAWPNSRFILTVRDKSAWLESISRHWPLMQEWAAECSQFDLFTRFILEHTYGSCDFDLPRLSSVYDDHLAAVRDYFSNRRSNRLLEIDVCGGDGWEKLCPFLNLPVPNTPFPHANSTSGKESGTRWIQQLREARADLVRHIPQGSRVVLIDDSKLSACGFEKGFRMKRLFEREGIDWGPPKNSSEAVMQLEARVKCDSEYLVVSWPAFWWFEVYPEFYQFLTENFRCRLATRRLMIFDLVR